MEETLQHFFAGLSPLFLLLAIVALIATLGKAADWLVGEAVILSERCGLPKVVIGATIVSLGTTTPEAAVSVFAAIQGESSVALGNAVGSVICDTGLILGIACLIAAPKLPRRIVSRQGWIQFAAGLLLVAACWPVEAPGHAFTDGGILSQFEGIGLVVLLVVYLYLSVYWARVGRQTVSLDEFEEDVSAPSGYVVAKLIVAIALVVGSSRALIPAVIEAASRLHVPEGVIAATLVAFGTSLPELVTAVTASRRGHGDLAVGNIIGADILNVLFVAGMAAAVTPSPDGVAPSGLKAGPEFFTILFPSMLFVLICFRIGTLVWPEELPRSFGFVLLAVYGATMMLSLAFLPAE